MYARRLLGAALAAGLALAALPSAASADSLVYTRDNNVWLSNADGSGAYQVTLDGTAASPYESPSQADDGTILAMRQPPGQRTQLFRMTQSGRLLNQPINTPAPGTGALDAKISPDGQLVAYWFVTTVNDPTCTFCVSLASQALISYSDRFTGPDEVGRPHTGAEPSWMSNDTLFLSNGSANTLYYTLGSPEADDWFFDGQLFPAESHQPTLTDGEVTSDGSAIAIVRGDNQESLLLASTNGAPPATPTPRCGITGPANGFASPTWSQDGGTLAWQGPDGISTATVAGLSNCNAQVGNFALRVPNGTDPDFGPAAVNPGPRPGCGNPGNPAACPAQGGGGGQGGSGGQGGGSGTGTGGSGQSTGGGGQGGSGGQTNAPIASVALAGQLPKLLSALKSGIVFTVGSDQAGTAQVELLAGGKLARTTVVARGSAKIGAPGTVKVKVKFTKAARKALKRRRSIKLIAKTTVTDQGGRVGARTTTIKLKR
jgi:hypothetical protein